MLKGMSERNTTQTRFGTQNRKQLAKGDKQIAMHYITMIGLIFFKFDLFSDEGTTLFRLAGAFKPHAENQTLGGYLNCQLHLHTTYRENAALYGISQNALPSQNDAFGKP